MRLESLGTQNSNNIIKTKKEKIKNGKYKEFKNVVVTGHIIFRVVCHLLRVLRLLFMLLAYALKALDSLVITFTWISSTGHLAQPSRRHFSCVAYSDTSACAESLGARKVAFRKSPSGSFFQKHFLKRLFFLEMRS